LVIDRRQLNDALLIDASMPGQLSMQVPDEMFKLTLRALDLDNDTLTLIPNRAA
jgi:hypothetical protein